MTTPTRATAPTGRGLFRTMRRVWRPTGMPDRNPLTRGDRVGLWVLLVLAAAYGLVVLISGIVASLGYIPVFSGGATSLTLLSGGRLPTAGLDGSATLLAGTYTEAELRVGGLSGAAAALLLTAQVVGAVTELTVIASVAFLTVRLLRGSPFLRSVTITAVFAAAAVIIGGMGAQAIRGLGQMQVVSELSDRIGSSVLDTGFVLDPTPFAVGFALAVVATAFQMAERLQRDTDGLV
jgi:hypothetical protein